MEAAQPGWVRHPDERGAPNIGIIRLLTQMDLMRSADRNFCSTPTSGNVNGFQIFMLWVTSGLTLTKLLWERMLEKETQHFPGCVGSSRISVGARRAASRPCVSSSVDVPVLKDSAPTRVGIDRAGIGMPSRCPPATHLLLRARRSHKLLKNLIAVVWIHRNVAIAVKNNGRDRWPVA